MRETPPAPAALRKRRRQGMAYDSSTPSSRQRSQDSATGLLTMPSGIVPDSMNRCQAAMVFSRLYWISFSAICHHPYGIITAARPCVNGNRTKCVEQLS